MLRVCRALLLVLCLPAASVAQSTVDPQVWTLLLATVRPDADWRVHLELQPRVGEAASGLDQSIARWAIGRQLNPRVSLWAGHAWIANPPGPGTWHEQRLWQQASVTLPQAAGWAPSLRFRLEQRFADRWSSTSHRARALARVTRPLDAERRWSLVAWDELFVTLDDTTIGPARGVDRNRVFGGARRQLSTAAALDAGYLWQAALPRSGPRQDVHAAFVWLDLLF